MFYKDLSFYQYYRSSPMKNLLNVGWLDDKNEFLVGASPLDFRQKLESIIIGNNDFDAHFNRVRCIHSCNICGERDITISNGKTESVLGMSEILVPQVENKLFFAAPSMIIHYVNVHNYLPPQPFIDAVMRLDLAQKYCADYIFDGL
ncbi:MAG: hypothetical protein V4732_02610 [Pseudomonadota bacterium]